MPAWSNPQTVGTGEPIVADLGEGLGHDALVTVRLTKDYTTTIRPAIRSGSRMTFPNNGGMPDRRRLGAGYHPRDLRPSPGPPAGHSLPHFQTIAAHRAEQWQSHASMPPFGHPHPSQAASPVSKT